MVEWLRITQEPGCLCAAVTDKGHHFNDVVVLFCSDAARLYNHCEKPK